MLSRYVHWAPIGVGLSMGLLGGWLLISINTTDLWLTLKELWPIEIWPTRHEVYELAEPVAHTVTVQSETKYQTVSTAKNTYLVLDDGMLLLCKCLWAPLLLLCGGVGLARAYQARYAPNFNRWIINGRPAARIFELETHQLRLVRPYPFRASLLTGRLTVAANELTEISENGSYAVLAEREKIFFQGEQAATVRAFAKRNGITLSTRSDTWQLLAAPLDPEGNTDPIATTETTLSEAGVRPNEIRQAHQVLWCWWWLSLRGLEGNEWHPYNHEDILYMTGASILPRHRWYWYTMELALRNSATIVT